MQRSYVTTPDSLDPETSIPITCMDATKGESRYLLALHDLAAGGHQTLQAELARHVGVSQPTALEMVRRLRGLGLIAEGSLGLTAAGTSAALVLSSRREAAEVLIREVLGVPEAQVAGEAESLAVTLSPLLAHRLVAWRSRHAAVNHGG